MKIYIENIGGIKKAEIDLSGLCVIASEDEPPLNILPRLVRETLFSFFNRSEQDAPCTIRDGLTVVVGYPIPLLSEHGRVRLSSDEKTFLDASVTRDGAVRLDVYEPPEFSLKAVHGYRESFGMWAKDRLFNRELGACNELFEKGLHPKKQLVLAKEVVGAVKNLEFVLITSHSPYMVEALKRYSDREGLSARFGLIENGVLEYDRLSAIFAGFAEPFEEFSRMDAEDMRDE
jgi:hypothetical protein